MSAISLCAGGFGLLQGSSLFLLQKTHAGRKLLSVSKFAVWDEPEPAVE